MKSTRSKHLAIPMFFVFFFLCLSLFISIANADVCSHTDSEGNPLIQTSLLTWISSYTNYAYDTANHWANHSLLYVCSNCGINALHSHQTSEEHIYNDEDICIRCRRRTDGYYSNSESICDHTDDYGYAQVGEYIGHWKRYSYSGESEGYHQHITIEYDQYTCSNCNEIDVWVSDWYEDCEYNNDNICKYCGYNTNGEFAGLIATSTPAPISTPTPTPIPTSTPTVTPIVLPTFTPSSTAIPCVHMDEYGVPYIAERPSNWHDENYPSTWNKSVYLTATYHNTTQYLNFVCSLCNEIVILNYDWEEPHIFENGVCNICSCTVPPTCSLNQLTDIDYIAFSSLAYKNAPHAQITIKEMLADVWNTSWEKTEIQYSDLYDHIANWRFLTYQENDSTGFYAMAFNNAQDEVVITYRGSIPLSLGGSGNGIVDGWWSDNEWNDVWNDWWHNDLYAIFGSSSNNKSQIPNAIDFYNHIAKSRSAKSIGVSGHSLGGALANIVSAYSGCYGRTVNAISALDVAYNTWPTYMSKNFTGTSDWAFYDYYDSNDTFAGAYAGKHKPARVLYFGREGYSGFQHHAISSIIYKDENNTIKPHAYYIQYPQYGNWPMNAINRVLQLGSINTDSFSPVPLSIIIGYTSYGGNGNDELTAGNLNDIIVGGLGNDLLDGHWGDDTYYYNKGDGLDTITDISGNDTIFLQGFDSSATFQLVPVDGTEYSCLMCEGTRLIKIRNTRANNSKNTLTLYNGSIRYDITSQMSNHNVNVTRYWEFACPIDIEIIDADGNVVYILKDDSLGNFYTDYGHFYVFPNENSLYNAKVLDLFDGYSFRVLGCANGEMSVLTQGTDNHILLDAYHADKIPVTSHTIIKPSVNAHTGQMLLLIDKNGDGTPDEEIPLRPIHPNEDDHDQPLTKVPAKEPTCSEDGNIQHYECSCGKLYSDSQGMNEITNPSSVIIPATGDHVYENGVCKNCGEAAPDTSLLPQTGDESIPFWWLTLALLSVVTTTAITHKTKKHSKS